MISITTWRYDRTISRPLFEYYFAVSCEVNEYSLYFKIFLWYDNIWIFDVDIQRYRNWTERTCKIMIPIIQILMMSPPSLQFKKIEKCYLISERPCLKRSKIIIFDRNRFQLGTLHYKIVYQYEKFRENSWWNQIISSKKINRSLLL